MEGRLSTGNASLDDVLGGGFKLGNVSLIYGEASTGKTILVVSSIVNHLNRDDWVKAFYIDSDKKLSTKRLIQVTGEQTALKRLLIWRPDSFIEQTRIIEGLKDLPLRGNPVVVDSISGLYRLEAAYPNRTFVVNKELNRQLGFLSEVAKTKEAAIIVVGQVHSVISSETPYLEPVAQRLLRYWSDTIIKLQMTSVSGVRQVTLEKPNGRYRTCRFKIDESGIHEVTRTW
jgi:RecA/RadA recombinase